MFDPELATNIANKFFHNLNQGTEVPEMGVDFNQQAQKWAPRIEQYTGLKVTNLPQAEVLSRSEWTKHNILATQPLMDSLSEQIEETANNPLAFVLPPEITDNIGKTILSGQVGVMFGFFSQRVLGQVEAHIMSGENKPLRLMFVGQNLKKTVDKLEVNEQDFYDWVIVHELTHVYQFAAVPWLKPFLAEKTKTHLENVKAIKDQTFNFPALVERIKNRDFSLVDISQSEDLQQMQNVMSIVEGYAEHVMDAVGGEEITSIKHMRQKLVENREEGSSGINGLIMKLLGMEMKMSQYQTGKEWCDKVVELSSVKTLNRVWEKVEHIPSTEELTDPMSWIERIEGVKPVQTTTTPTTPVSKSQEDEQFLVSLISGKCDIEQEDFVRWLVLAEAQQLVEYKNNTWEVTPTGRKRLVEILQSEV